MKLLLIFSMIFNYNRSEIYPFRGRLRHSVNLSQSQKHQIVTQHNQIRAEAADGRLKTGYPARAMNTLAWDFELADSAKRYADLCNYEHSNHVGRKYHKFKNAMFTENFLNNPNLAFLLPYNFGENLAITTRTRNIDNSIKIDKK